MNKAQQLIQRLKEKDLSKYDSLIDNYITESLMFSEGTPVYLDVYMVKQLSGVTYFNRKHLLEKLRLEGFIAKTTIDYENSRSPEGVEQFVISLPEEEML